MPPAFRVSVIKEEEMARIQIQPAAHVASHQQPAVDNGNNNQLLPKSLYVGDLEPNVNIQPVAHGVSQQQTAVDNGNNNQVLPKSLYVGDLDPNVNVAQMYDLFC